MYLKCGIMQQSSPNLILIFDEPSKNKSDLTIGWFKQEFID
jgi:hypothetical protein